MNILITGGTGFVGSYVVRRLLQDGHLVTILARDPAKIPGFVGDPRIQFIQGTMASPDALRRSVAHQDACIHIAISWGDTAVEMARVETLPSIELIELATDAGVRQIIYTSSVAVFDEPVGKFDDNTAPRPARYYGATKAAVEAYLMAVAATRNVRANVIRPGYTFGNPVVDGAPMQKMPELPQMVRLARLGEPIPIGRHDGLQFIWAGDLATVYGAVLSSTVDRRCFTALSPEFITWEQIAHWAIDAAGSRSEVVVSDEGLPPPIPHYDVSALDRAFGLRFSAEEQLRNHLEYLAGRP